MDGQDVKAADLLTHIERELAQLSPEERSRYEKEIEQATADMRWVPNPGPQTRAYFSKADQLLYGGRAGGGKLQCTDNLILTPFGWKRLGDLEVGDKICATDGTVTDVMGIFPQGEVDLYRVTMMDGGSTEAGLEHNWLAWETHVDRKIGNKQTAGPASARKYTTREIIEQMEKPRHDGVRRRFVIPLCKPVAFNVAGGLVGKGNFIGRPIDPYLLGVLVGDGSYVHPYRVNVTSADEEILLALRALAGDDIRIDDREGSKAKGCHFRGEFLKETAKALSDLKMLGCRSETKFIPRQYLYGPVDVRWATLQGLMDTDGWIEPKRSAYYTTISKQLADDVTHLARSLGAMVTRTEKIPTYTHHGEKKEGQLAYCLRIRIDNPKRLFRLSRKIEIAAEIEHQSEGRIIDKIEFSRRAEAVCISVRHPNNLYITDDFIVTHNTDLLLALASQEHDRSLLLRRQNKEVHFLVERMTEILGHQDGYNGQDKRWRMSNGKIIMFGGCQHEGDEKAFKGEPKDLIGVDEASEFLESQVIFVNTWLRSAKEGQRKRIVFATNPPTTVDGEWIVRWFAPWLDDQHELYGKIGDGELLWCIRDGDKFLWFEKEGTYPTSDGRMVPAISRTFIRSGLKDNPELDRSGEYAANLANLPEALRLKYEQGHFGLNMADDAWQVIPSDWVKRAMDRWTDKPPQGAEMTSIGVDVAQGGVDKTVLACRYGDWFAPIVAVPGIDTRDGVAVAQLVFREMRNNPQVNIDIGGGYGGHALSHLRENEVSVLGFQGNEGTMGKDMTGQLTFLNRRAEAWWMLREALDPNSTHKVALPPSPTLRTQLCCARWLQKSKNVVQIESKDDMKARLNGRSPDHADAVVMAWYTRETRTRPRLHEMRNFTQSNMGHSSFKAMYRRGRQGNSQPSMPSKQGYWN
jgi:hypothetical protein